MEDASYSLITRKQKISKTDKPDLTENEEELREAISDMVSRVGELRKTLINLEQNTSQFNQSEPEDIEPPITKINSNTLFCWCRKRHIVPYFVLEHNFRQQKHPFLPLERVF